jgi:hypothetical protein
VNLPRALLRSTLAILALLACSGQGLAEEMALSAETQVPLILKILTYDRNLEGRAGPELAVGIVHDPTNRESAAATDAMVATLYRFQGKTIKKLALRFYTIEYTGPVELERFVRSKGICVLYVAPGLERHIAALTKVSQAQHLMTVTGVPDYVRKGIALGLGLAQDRPQILVNLVSARAEGTDFDASLLRIATIIGPR